MRRSYLTLIGRVLAIKRKTSRHWGGYTFFSSIIRYTRTPRAREYNLSHFSEPPSTGSTIVMINHGFAEPPMPWMCACACWSEKKSENSALAQRLPLPCYFFFFSFPAAYWHFSVRKQNKDGGLGRARKKMDDSPSDNFNPASSSHKLLVPSCAIAPLFYTFFASLVFRSRFFTLPSPFTRKIIP